MPDAKPIDQLFHRGMLKKEASLVAELFIRKPEMLGQLIEFIGNDDRQKAPIASWILGTIWETDASVVKHLQSEMIQCVLGTSFDSVRRNLLRIIQDFTIPEKFLSPLFDRCLQWYVSEEVAVAVRANALQLLYRISCVEPQLAGEVIDQIQWMDGYGSPALKSRSGILMKKLRRLQIKSLD